jgi:glycosyltransferase involved in cell wall biosynthesis
MKVAHLTTVDVSLRYLVLPQLLAARDAGAEVIGISASGPWVPELESHGIRHVPLTSSTRSANPVSDGRAIAELWQILRRERPDVLHTHNPKPGVYGRIVGRIARVPIVVNTVHGLYATADDRVAKRAAVYGLEAVAARFSDAELIQNPEDLELMRRWHLTRRDARLLGNGVDLDRFEPAKGRNGARDALRDQIGARPDHIVVGAVGRLVAEKGYRELFAAARKLGSERFRFVVIGGEDPEKSDSLTDAERREARAIGVHFLGHRDDVEQWYLAMDLFVLASYREGFPRAAMEAAASGLPVIATDVRGCRQVVEAGVTGLLVPARAVEPLEQAIRCLGDDEILRREMARAARERAVRDFDERAVVRRVLDCYDFVAIRKGLSSRFTPTNC